MDQQEAETETENISLEDTLNSLKRNAYAVEIYFQETKRKLKDFQHKLAEESDKISELPLQPRTRMMKWLSDRGLAAEIPFTDFFEVFVEEHKKEHRLDLSNRSIHLNTAACILFGYNDINPIVSIYELLGKLNTLYY